VTNEQWSRAQPVLTLALGLDPAARDRLLQSALQIEPDLRVELARVLRELELATRRQGVRLTDATTRSATPGRDGEWLSRAFPPSGPLEGSLLNPGDLCGHYRIVRLLGVGGMGQVYLAEDLDLGTPAALKLVSDELLQSADARARLHREAARAAQLRYHQHIATVLQFMDVEVKGRTVAVLAMEYVAGTPASHLIAAGPLKADDAIRIAIQVTRAIEFAHDKGILHCDLKPANLHVEQGAAGPNVKVLDFGIARALFEERSGERLGTPPYMAPEQLVSGDCRTATDIYALGVTLFELLTGRRPYIAVDGRELLTQIISAPVPNASAFVSGVPPGLDAVLQRALAKRPEERYASMAEFRSELERLVPAAPVDSVRVPKLAAIVAGGVAFVTVIGAVASRAVDRSLDGETVVHVSDLGQWFFWGLRSLVAPAVFSVTLVVSALCVSSAARLFWQLLGRRSRLLRAGVTAIRSRLLWLAALPTGTSGQLLLLIHAAILALLGFSFRSLLIGFMNFATDGRGPITALRPSNLAVHEMYGYLVTTELLVFCIAWYALLRETRRRREREGFVYVWAGLAAVGLSLFLFSARYRILYHNQHMRVVYASQPCYLIQERGATALVFCPLAYPRYVIADVSTIRRTGLIESIFTPLDNQ
jgi:hypothetical protein